MCFKHAFIFTAFILFAPQPSCKVGQDSAVLLYWQEIERTRFVLTSPVSSRLGWDLNLRSKSTFKDCRCKQPFLHICKYTLVPSFNFRLEQLIWDPTDSEQSHFLGATEPTCLLWCPVLATGAPKLQEALPVWSSKIPKQAEPVHICAGKTKVDQSKLAGLWRAKFPHDQQWRKPKEVHPAQNTLDRKIKVKSKKNCYRQSYCSKLITWKEWNVQNSNGLRHDILGAESGMPQVQGCIRW